jgi:hypothetical protein
MTKLDVEVFAGCEANMNPFIVQSVIHARRDRFTGGTRAEAADLEAVIRVAR